MRKTLVIQPFGFRLEIFIGDGKSFKRSGLGKHFEDFDPATTKGYAGWVEWVDDDQGGRVFIMWFSESSVDIGIVAHESFHVATDILEYAGVEDEESTAYLVGYISQTVAEMIWKFK